MVAVESHARPPISEIRAELMRAHQLFIRKEKTVLAVLCGGLIALSLAVLLKPKK
jgi:hypothetical protein